MPTSTATRSASPFAVGVLAWLVPGGGYYLLGQKSRAATVFVSVVTLFLLGILIGGIRIMDPPGYDDNGRLKSTIDPLNELGNKPWYVGQVLCGPIALAASAFSIHEANLTYPVPTSYARSWEIGALYTAVAGMLNLLVIIDAAYHAGRPEEARV